MSSDKIPRADFEKGRKKVVSVLIVGLSYGARNILSYTRHMMHNFLPFRDSPIIPLRRSPRKGLVKWLANTVE